MNDDQKKNSPPPAQNRPGLPSRRPPVSIFIWLIIIMMIVTLFVYKYNPAVGAREEWSQTTFEKKLTAGDIKTAVITPESENVMYIEGEYKKPARPANSEVTDLTRKLAQKDSKQPVKFYYSTRVIKTDAIMKGLDKVKVEVLQRDNWWKNLIVNLIIGILIIGFIYILFSRQLKMAGKGAMQFGKSRARMITADENKKKFDDVAGCDEAKEETKEIVDYLKDPLKFKMLGGRIPKGALLMGPPGTGKTLLAKAVAGEANVPFFAISGSDFVEMFVGVGASRVRDMFEQARKNAPCLIFIDEIDAVGRSRFTGIGGGHDEREQTLNAMLVEMDGLETQEGVIVLAATNRADVLDPALLRPGRFDRQIVIDLPDIRGRRKILDVHAKNIKLDPSVNLDTIAKSTPGFSGADLANLTNEAALLAARNNRHAAIQADLEEARDKVRWGRERKSRKISERERKLTAWHEAGHAIVNLHCKNAMGLHKVTIIPRGQAYLGATMMMPDEDRYSQSRLEMIDAMIQDMGGRVAEELVLGDITSGASADIEHATKVAKAMVCAFGMSEKLGTVQYGERADHIYLGRDITRSESFSEETAREIDLEIKRIVMDAKAAATRILTEHRDELDKLANALLEKETLDAAEIRELLGMPPHIAKDTDVLDENLHTEGAASDGNTKPE